MFSSPPDCFMCGEQSLEGATKRFVRFASCFLAALFRTAAHVFVSTPSPLKSRLRIHSQSTPSDCHPRSHIVRSSAVARSTLVVFLLSFSSYVAITLLALPVSFLVTLITPLASALDIAPYAFVKHEVGKLSGIASHTVSASPFIFFSSFLEVLFTSQAIALRMTVCVRLPWCLWHATVWCTHPIRRFVHLLSRPLSTVYLGFSLPSDGSIDLRASEMSFSSRGAHSRMSLMDPLVSCTA
ncbi:hypothetical protein C8Q74DRAFT_134049 [Fomes fomentarius]|nr:hypothetical protein C8Q74DRAFT_134049 [Fomes fomentarius]